MSKPTPGKQYIITSEDSSLRSIAARAFGDEDQWVRIFNANQNTLKTANPEDITTGQVINIPVIPENELFKTNIRELQLTNKEVDELTIMVGSIEIKPISATIFKSIDSLAHGWSFVIDWTPGKDKELDKLLIPYTYPKAAVYIGGKLKVNGLIYGIKPLLSKNGSTITLDGWSFTADLIDSSLRPPYERNKITLRELAEALIKPFGINVIYDIDDDEFFDRATATSTESIFKHLSKLAKQRAVLMTATPSGDVLFTRANKSKTVGTLSEGEPGVLEFLSEFNGRLRYSIYKANGQSPLSASKSAIAEDINVPRSRFKTFNVDETKDGNIQDAANWKRSKTIADALTIPFTVSGWQAPDGSIWDDNTLITIISPTLFLPNGFTFLIKSVTFKFDNAGKTAILNLVPPKSLTKDIIKDPWGIAS